MNRKVYFVCGMLIPFMYIFMYVLGGALRPGYNHISDSVSELLSPGAPNKSLLTIIDLVYGLLHIFFGIGILQFIRESEYNALIGNIGAWMIMAVGIAIIGTAIFPQDAMGSPATIPGRIHLILVFGALLPFSIISTLLIAIWLRRTGVFPGFATYSFISFAAIILLGGFGGAQAGTPMMGLGERVSAIAIHQWLFFFALKLFTG
jgi:Protein of unknown function (DUF998)